MASRFALVLALSGLGTVGCGASGPGVPGEPEVRAHVESRYGSRLVTSPATLDPPPSDPSTRPLETGGNPKAQAGTLQRFTRAPVPVDFALEARDRPQRARLVDFKITATKPIAGQKNVYDIDYEATQELEVDLCKVIYGAEYKRAIGWEDGPFHDAAGQAAKLPANEDLDKKWRNTLATREAMIHCVYPKGSKWTTTGKIRAEPGGSPWNFRILSLRGDKSPEAMVVSTDDLPPDLIRVDPKNLKATAAEWKKPYEEFIAEVAARTLELKTNAAKQPELLRGYLAAGKVWRTQVSRDQEQVEIEISIEKSESSFDGVFTAKSGSGAPTRVNFAGTMQELSASRMKMIDANPDKVPFRLYGMGVLVIANEPKLPTPWNKLRFILAADIKDDAPTLIWQDQVKKLSPAK